MNRRDFLAGLGITAIGLAQSFRISEARAELAIDTDVHCSPTRSEIVPRISPIGQCQSTHQLRRFAYCAMPSNLEMMEGNRAIEISLFRHRSAEMPILRHAFGIFSGRTTFWHDEIWFPSGDYPIVDTEDFVHWGIILDGGDGDLHILTSAD